MSLLFRHACKTIQECLLHINDDSTSLTADEAAARVELVVLCNNIVDKDYIAQITNIK